MSHDEFVVLVERMLTAQRLYFQTRSPQCLEDAKRLEAEARQAIKEHKAAKIRAANGQKDLF